MEQYIHYKVFHYVEMTKITDTSEEFTAFFGVKSSEISEMFAF
jgi:hypothetical protein